MEHSWNLGSSLHRPVAQLDQVIDAVVAWNANPEGAVSAICISIRWAYLGGVFTTFGGQTQP